MVSVRLPALCVLLSCGGVIHEMESRSAPNAALEQLTEMSPFVGGCAKSNHWMPIFQINTHDNVKATELWDTVYQTTFRPWWPYIKQLRFSMQRKGQPLHYVTFDAELSTSRNWFSCARIIESSYTDLNYTTATNYFSIQGDSARNRRFFINKSYGGCDVDSGWMAVISELRVEPCAWESREGEMIGKNVRLHYCPGPTYCNLKQAIIADNLLIEVLF